MSTSETITKTDLKNILEAAGNIGQVDSTPTPTAGKVSEFDAAANINSTDMSASELTNFLENLDPHGSGGGSGTPIPTANTTAAFDSNANMNSSDMTTAQVDTLVGNITAAGGSLIDFFYPVGSYYETSDTTFNPNISWGGTWVLETEGQVHVSSGENYEVGDTGGAETQSYPLGASGACAIRKYSTVFYFGNPSAIPMPKVTSGSQQGYWETTGNADAFSSSVPSANPNIQGTQLYGNTESGNNMQPYIVVNRWHRTA